MARFCTKTSCTRCSALLLEAAALIIIIGTALVAKVMPLIKLAP